MHSIVSLQAARTMPSKQPKTESTQLKVIQSCVSRKRRKSWHKPKADKRLRQNKSLTWCAAIREGDVDGYATVLAARKAYGAEGSTCRMLTQYGRNELHLLAIYSKNEEMWKVLKKHVETIPEHAKNHKDFNERTPLYYALLNDNFVAIKHLS
jgi:hypothetical protein